MFFYIVLTPISTTSGLWSTGNTRKYHQIDVYIYQCGCDTQIINTNFCMPVKFLISIFLLEKSDYGLFWLIEHNTLSVRIFIVYMIQTDYKWLNIVRHVRYDTNEWTAPSENSGPLYYVLSVCLGALRRMCLYISIEHTARLRSDWASVQSDRSLCWAQSQNVRYVMHRLLSIAFFTSVLCHMGQHMRDRYLSHMLKYLQ